MRTGRAIDIDIDEIIGNMQRAVDQYKNKIKRETLRAAMNIQNNARINCPVDMGRLRSSIRYMVINDGYGALIFSDVFYAPYVEYGTGMFASNGRGRRTPWSYFSTRFGWTTTRGQKPKFMITNAWLQERPKLLERLSRIRGV